MQSCEPLPDLVEPATLEQLLRNHVQTTHLYHQVCSRHRELSAWANGQ